MSAPSRCPRCGIELISLGLLGDWCSGCETLAARPSKSLPATLTATAGLQQAVDRLLRDPDPETASIIAFTPGEIVAERYRVVSLIGRGGMGSVYRADDLRVGQPVALKFLSPALSRDQTRLERFIREVRVARQISHPNVCRVFDLGDTNGRHYLSMEYIDGEDLASLLRRVSRLPPVKALDVAHQLCAGLSAAHEKGVLHLDLKPANVMIDGRGRALITDFGIATAADDVSSARRAGTPAYMSPEQFMNGSLAIQTDLYALGLVLYETFTGRRVFDATSASDRSRSHRNLVPPSNLVGDIDPAVERAILACLEEDQDKRPRSAIEVAASLPGGDPVSATLAAGRLPSPDMIAATRRETLRPALAGILAAGLVTGVTILSLLNRHALRDEAPRLSPPVLVARAQELIRSFGYGQPPADSAHWFTWKESYAEQAADRDATFRLFEGDQPKTSRVLRFVYRQSPTPLVPANAFGVIRYSDPPAVVPGMVDVNLDTDGRLLRLCVVSGFPEQPDSPGAKPDWSALLEAAGLDPAALSPVAPLRSPPMLHDAWAEWALGLPGADRRMRITAAAFHGKPVYFRRRHGRRTKSGFGRH
jgi:serine/threonine protein kinase